MATKSNNPTKTADKAVRDYLAFLENPSDFIDQRLVNRLQKQFDKESDPAAKLDLYQEIEAAKRPNGDKVTAAFIKHAKAWAEASGIEGETFFKVYRIDREVLSEAGFEIRTGKYKPRVKGAVVREHIANLTEPFTALDIFEATGASEAGARNVIAAMIEEGSVVEMEERGESVNGGKAPAQYKNV